MCKRFDRFLGSVALFAKTGRIENGQLILSHLTIQRINRTAQAGSCNEKRKLVETFRAKIVDTGASHFIIEVTGRREKLDALIRLLDPFGIKKLSRSGMLALYREPE
ncbi:MAG: acetolactate synthase small subunit [Desulfobacterales bacterium]|nr:acetolactate synthase small subunit [Desulfobacterales bacterium]